jgi:hypothetical protein
LGFRGFLLFAEIAGDCVPEATRGCLSDNERRTILLLIFVGSVVVFTAAVFVWRAVTLRLSKLNR